MSAVSDASLVSSLSALSVGGLTALPSVRLIPFDIFKQLGQMPRCPENRDILVKYEDTIRDESLYIFMSHCWLRGWSGAPGWDGRPHPDTSTHDKYQLMVAASREWQADEGVGPSEYPTASQRHRAWHEAGDSRV